jgi:hypothetical protein
LKSKGHAAQKSDLEMKNRIQQMDLKKSGALRDGILIHLEQLCRDFLNTIIQKKAKAICFKNFEIKSLGGPNEEESSQNQEKQEALPSATN